MIWVITKKKKEKKMVIDVFMSYVCSVVYGVSPSDA